MVVVGRERWTARGMYVVGLIRAMVTSIQGIKVVL